jgi:hypothetical protein
MPKYLTLLVSAKVRRYASAASAQKIKKETGVLSFWPNTVVEENTNPGVYYEFD